MRLILLSLLSCACLTLTAQEEPSSFQWGLDAGFRQDRGQWTISGGEEGPNIVSDLEWDDLEIYEFRATGQAAVGRVIVDAELAYGEMVSGTNRDSDYAFDDREGEFSRSIADTEGNTLDFEIGVGVPFTVSESGILLLPSVGYSLHQQNHTDTNGVQELDNPALEAQLDGIPSDLGPDDGLLGPFDGLDSTYDAEWTGPYLGLRTIMPVGKSGTVVASYQFHIVEYYADLYWNLRDLSFENEADGIGHALTVAYLYPLTETLTLSLEGSYTRFESDEGIQTDPEGDIDLNGAEWESMAFRVGVIIQL